MSNLDLWNAVSKTDPAHTKPITGKAYSGTSPKPYYLIQKATETFGPCGIGWGFEIVEEKLLDGALLEPGFYERIHTARIRVWYEWQGKRGTVEHVGQTLFCGKRKQGNAFSDEDAPKKSVTDALVKALSMIGFAGDIFIGRFDDSKYVAEIRKDFAEEYRASEHTESRPTQTQYIAEFRKKLENCRTRDDILYLWKNEAKMRDIVGIPSGTELRTQLYEELKDRGRSIAAQKSAVQSNDSTSASLHKPTLDEAIGDSIPF